VLNRFFSGQSPAMPKKSLIITADDFGISESVNLAVITGWRHGLLTCASLMVTGAAFSQAIALAKENPGLQTGLHLTLVQGRSAAEHKGFPSLTHHDGSFSHDPVFAGMRLFFLKSLQKQIEIEIEAQIEKFLSTGLPLTHIDGHLNIHMHPTVFAILCKLMPNTASAHFDFAVNASPLKGEYRLNELSAKLSMPSSSPDWRRTACLS
jgi:hopanoid biosynthesis associated protein HpnK